MSKKTLDKVTLTVINETVSTAILEMKRQGMVKDNVKTPFQKTEQLLYNYQAFKRVVKDKTLEIENIRANGLPQKSKSITSYAGDEGLMVVKSEMELVDEKIAEIEASIAATKKFIGVLDDALDALRDDKYFEIIPLKYFEGKTYEEISEIMGVDISTVSRNKNRLINELKIKLFSDEVLFEIFA